MFNAILESRTGIRSEHPGGEAEAVLQQLLVEMPDVDPHLSAYQALQRERTQLLRLSEALRTSKDPQSLARFANANGVVGQLIPSVSALESLTSTDGAKCADDIDRFIKKTVDPAIEGLFGRGFWKNLFGYAALLVLISVSGHVLVGVIIATITLLILSSIWNGELDTQTDGPDLDPGLAAGATRGASAPMAKDLVSTAKALNSALDALVAITKLRFPTNAGQAQVFKRNVLRNSQALSGIGLKVVNENVEVQNLFSDTFGTGKALGYGPDTLKTVGGELTRLRGAARSQFVVVAGALKQMDSDGDRFFSGDVGAEDKAAIQDAIIVYRAVVAATLRRLPKATTHVAFGARRAAKAFYRTPKT